MNFRDKNNLEFLMGISNEEFDDWLEVASNDDVDYALELIRKSKTEKMVEIIELQDLMAQYEDDMTDAKMILERIQNVGKN
jgi:allophanate hydrolase subunit 1